MIQAALAKLTKHSVIYAAGPAVNKLLGFLLLPFVTSRMSTDDYGVLEIGSVTIAIAGQVLGVNLLHGMTRFHGEYERAEDRARLVGTTLLLLAWSTGTALLLAWLLRAPATALVFHGRASDEALVAVFAILFFQTIGQVGLRWLQILERSVLYGVLTSVKLVLEIGLKIWLLLAGLTYMGAFWSVLGCEALIALGFVGWIAWKQGLSFSRPMAARLWRYSAPLILSGLCMFVLHQADRFFVQRLHGEGEVGLYGLAYKLGAIGNAVFLEAFGLIWFPYVFTLKDDESVRAICRRVLVYFNLLMVSASLALAVFAREIVAVSSAADYHAAWRAMPVVALGYVFWSLFQVVHTVFYVRETTRTVSILVACAAALNLALNALLVPAHGYLGAAWATVGTFGALAVASWIAAERVLRVGHEVGRVAVPIVLAVALYVASTWLPASSVPLQLALKAAIVLAFPLVLLGAGYLHPEEMSKIKEIWRNVRSGAGPWSKP